MASPAFQPSRWLRNAHLQTLWSTFMRRALVLPRRRERLELPDGDFVDLDWLDPDLIDNHAGKAGQTPLVILLHGLGGSSSSSYILGQQLALQARGWRSVALNFRGQSGEPNRLPRSYHSGETGDLDYLVQSLRAREPHTPLHAAGFSLGGNVLLKWLGEQGAAAGLCSAAAVSVPLCLDQCATHLDQGFSRVYRQHLLTQLALAVEHKKRALRAAGQRAQAERLAALGEPFRVRSFWAWDNNFVAPLYGFRDAADYYAQSSSRSFLSHIRVPTLLVQACDDPFMPPSVLPVAGELSAFVEMQVTAWGGHVGFVAGPLWQPHYWLEQRLPEWQARQSRAARLDTASFAGQYSANQCVKHRI